LKLVAEGHTNTKVAGAPFLSPRTVKMHIADAGIFTRLDCLTRTLAVRKAGLPKTP